MANKEENGGSSWTHEQIIQLVKEVVTAILGILILLFTLVLIIRTFGLIGNPDKTQLAAGKDILQILLGLAGVVVGYYFGKVPADAQAARARDEANDANERSLTVTHRAGDLAEELDAILDEAAGVRTSDRALHVQDPGFHGKAEKVRDELRALSRMGYRN